MQKIFESVKSLKLPGDNSTKKIDKEKLSERAVHMLRKLNYYEGFSIVDTKIFLKETERTFNNGYEENIM